VLLFHRVLKINKRPFSPKEFYGFILNSIVTDNRTDVASAAVTVVLVVVVVVKKVKQSLYTPWRRLGGEEV
jgi:hypothetical protein